MKTDAKVKPTLHMEDYDNVVGFVISRAGHSLKRLLDQAFVREGLGLRAREFPVLNRLHQFGKLTQTELCELTYPDRPAMTRTLVRLIAAGLVSKDVEETDRRAFSVSLTKKGQEVRNRAAEIVVAILQRVCGDVGSDDLQTTIRVLHQIHDAAQQLDRSASQLEKRS